MTGNSATRAIWLQLATGAIILAGVGVLIGIPVYERYYGEPNRFAAVEPGVLYRSAQPKLGEIDHLVDEVGVRTIVIARDTMSKRVDDEPDYARSRGVRVVHLPIESRKPVPEEYIQAFFNIVDDPANHPVLVHCSAGRHRTGLLCGLYRVERQGWSIDRAVEEMLSFDPDMSPDREVLQQLKEYKPGRFARDAMPRRGQAASRPAASSSPTSKGRDTAEKPATAQPREVAP